MIAVVVNKMSRTYFFSIFYSIIAFVTGFFTFKCFYCVELPWYELISIVRVKPKNAYPFELSE